MPKFKQYQQKFRKEWLKESAFKEWIAPADDENKAFCKFCRCSLCKYQNLKSHALTNKHKRSLPFKATPLTSSFIKEKNNDSHVLEGSIAMFLSCHSAIFNCDHMVDMLKHNISNCKTIDDVKMHRTKCTNIIKNVLCPHFEEELTNDIGNNKFSLLLDESNNISVKKLLGISIIYYSHSSHKVESTYLGIIQLEKCDALSIIKALKQLLISKKVNINNCIAIGTDNASVMVGINNGVYTKLKQEYPHLILMRCVCHSIQLAMSYASAECLPRNLEFLIAETHNCFAKSSVRQSQYNQLYNLSNEGSHPLKIPSDSKTRWLSIQLAVDRIVFQWLELKTLSQTLFGNPKGPVKLGSPNTCAETKLCLNFILFRLKK